MVDSKRFDTACGPNDSSRDCRPPRATNAIEAARGRDRSSTDRRAQTEGEADSAQRRPENSIQPAKRRPKAADAPSRPKQRREAVRQVDGQAAALEPGRGPGGEDASTANASPEPHRLVPEHVRERFVQVGKHYYFADGARAFTDRGGRLTTPSENTEVIRSLVAIAEARGWSEITVRGTDRFRKEAWFAARLAGLEVRGYRPTEFEQAHLVRTLARDKGGILTKALERRRVALSAARFPPMPRGRGRAKKRMPPARARHGGLLTGKLVDHGRATYRHDPREPMSYFVKIETPRGRSHDLGRGPRARHEGIAQPAADRR